MKLKPQVIPEKHIQEHILCYLKMKGLFVWQNKTQGTYDPSRKMFRKPGRHHLNGVPDILGILPDGKFLGIEVKSAKGRVSEHQKDFIAKASYIGAICFVARSLEDVLAHLKKLKYL